MHLISCFLHVLRVIQPLKSLGCQNQPPPLSVAPFIPKCHVTCHTCMCDDVIGDIITSRNDIMSQLIMTQEFSDARHMWHITDAFVVTTHEGMYLAHQTRPVSHVMPHIYIYSTKKSFRPYKCFDSEFHMF